ncbi:MAG: hypothetical protein IM674_01335 [Brevundimonas sp.]|nr:hypothetical protein [Brevundimonas sp.]
MAKQREDQNDPNKTPEQREKEKDEADKTDYDLGAWKKARADGKLCLFEDDPARWGNIVMLACTTSDTPSDPSGSGLPFGVPGHTSGTYWISQTMFQFTGLNHQFLLDACPCAVALVMLHEGHRLNQSTLPPPGAPPTPAEYPAAKAQAQNDQAMANGDLANVDAAKRTCMPAAVPQNPKHPDNQCRDYIAIIEGQARQLLAFANHNAAWLTARGANTPQVPASH